MANKTINDYPESTSPSGEWYVLVDDGTGCYKKVKLSNLPGGGSTSTTSSSTSSSTTTTAPAGSTSTSTSTSTSSSTSTTSTTTTFAGPCTCYTFINNNEISYTVPMWFCGGTGYIPITIGPLSSYTACLDVASGGYQPTIGITAIPCTVSCTGVNQCISCA